jgi:hypothetical protein
VLLGLLVLLKAAFYYLDRFGLNFSPRGSVTGAGYADVHATLPAKTVLLVVAVICAVLFFVNVFRRGFALPGIALGLLVFSALVIGGVYPAIVQDFTVKPNELNLEAPYIQRNINATQAAYQIGPRSKANPGGVVYQNSGGSAVPSVATVAKATSTIPHARLLDPNDLQSTFEQLQQIRAYYSFPRTLDVDRYTIDGTEQEYLVGVRDIDLTGLPSGENNWPNEHLIYTHGDGFVAAAVSSVTTQGKPVFSDGNIPPSGPPSRSASPASTSGRTPRRTPSCTPPRTRSTARAGPVTPTRVTAGFRSARSSAKCCSRSTSGTATSCCRRRSPRSPASSTTGTR